MADVVLILTSSIFAALVLIASVYFLVYFQHPDDNWVAWGPKIVVVLGLSICCYNVLLLPLDVANQGGQFEATGGIPMDELILAMSIITIIFSLAIVPFFMFYYEGIDESDEPGSDTCKQVTYALGWCTASLVVFFLADSLLWYYAGYADIDVVELCSPLRDSADVKFSDYCPSSSTDCTVTTGLTENVIVSYIMYLVAIASFLGWILFTVFGGVGLAALPFDLLLSFKHRARKITISEYTDKKSAIGQEAASLLETGIELQKKMKENYAKKKVATRKAMKQKRKENQFKRDVLHLEDQFNLLEDSYKRGGGNVVLQYATLALGIVGALISLFWFIHICIYVLPIAAYSAPLSPFLNSFFENTFAVPVFGISFYGLFSFWLLLCVMKGTIKVGVRFLVITIHPVQMGKTMMSSLVFNVGLMLLASMAVTQFCTYSFSEYAKYTASVTIFGSQLSNLRGIRYVYSFLIYVFPSMTFLTTFYIWLKPYDTKKPVV